MDPLSRRASLALTGAVLVRHARARDSSEAGTFIQQAGKELGSLVAGATDLAERRRRLIPFIERVVDVDGLGRFCLGRFWTVATPDQRADYLRLYRLVLANGIASRLGEYSEGNVRVTAARPEVRGDGIYVPTTVERPNNRPNRVVWVVIPSADSFRITDVIAEGISLRVTQRSDFASFLTRNGGDVGTLLRAMQTQLQ